MKYVCNDIVKPFKVEILRYAKRVHEIYYLVKYLHTPSMKGDSEMADNWSIRDKYFTTRDLRLYIKDRLTKSMMDELDDHTEDYSSLTYGY